MMDSYLGDWKSVSTELQELLCGSSDSAVHDVEILFLVLVLFWFVVL